MVRKLIAGDEVFITRAGIIAYENLKQISADDVLERVDYFLYNDDSTVSAYDDNNVFIGRYGYHSVWFTIDPNDEVYVSDLISDIINNLNKLEAKIKNQ